MTTTLEPDTDTTEPDTDTTEPDTDTTEPTPTPPNQIAALQAAHPDDLAPLMIQPHMEMDRWVVQPWLWCADTLALLAWSQHLAQCRYEIRRDNGITHLAAIGLLDGLLLETRTVTHRHIPADATGVTSFAALRRTAEQEATDHDGAAAAATEFYDTQVAEHHAMVAAVLDGLRPVAAPAAPAEEASDDQ